MQRNRTTLLLTSILAGLTGLSGCSNTLISNLTKERTGNITIVFVNTTPFRASFSYGTYDAWDRSPGPVTVQQLALEGNTTSNAATVPCRRNAAVGTDDFVTRVIDTDANLAADFNEDLFSDQVFFSSAPSGSGAANLPTEGFALGREVLLGVDYSCADQLIFTLIQDASVPGGFRIDFEVIRDQNRDDPNP